MVMAIAPNRPTRPPPNRLTQEVVLAGSAAGRDIAEHMEDESDSGLMVRRILASTKQSHGVRNIHPLELELPVRHCPAA